MAKKSFDPKAKEKKQKKIAIAGFVLLLALGAYQGPKTLKLLHPGPPPQSVSTVPTPTPATPAPATPGATATPAAPSATAPTSSALIGADVLVVNADLSPVPLDGQIAVFSQFSSKDPFQPQEATALPADGPGPTTPTDTTAAPTTTGSFTPTTSTTPSSSTTTPAAPPPTTVTISVNGVKMAVNVKGEFPASSPFFKLVSVTPTSAKIGIAGGSLATGSPTVTLKKGKAVTLMNTADGTRYVLVLVAFSDTTTPAAGTSSAAQPLTGTTPTTTPTTTTPGG
jgi:hypothetical protein